MDPDTAVGTDHRDLVNGQVVAASSQGMDAAGQQGPG